MLPEIIRYNSLREMADVVIDYPSSYYKSFGVDVFPAGNGMPTVVPDISPLRIFVKTDLLQSCLSYLRLIAQPFHLLTGSSDLPGCDNPEFAENLRSTTKIVSWCGTNLEVKYSWMRCIPIGLEERGRRGREHESICELFNFCEKKKEIDIYMPFFGDTNPIRKQLVDQIKRLNCQRIEFEPRRLSLEKYVERLKEARYTICLPGNGYDIIRVYEALLCHSTPIVFNTPISEMHSRFGAKVIKQPNEILATQSPNNNENYVAMISYSVIRNEIFEHQSRCYDRKFSIESV